MMEALRREYVWDRVVRLTHWTIALSMLLLAVTGIYLGSPFIEVPGAAGDHFVMGTMRVLHLYGGIAFTVAVLSRILWMFVGPPVARWHQFVPVTRQRLVDLWSTLLFYLLIRRDAPPQKGHNPLAGAAYGVVFLMYLFMVVTGLGLWGMFADVWWLWPFTRLIDLIGGPPNARYLHHIVMWLLIGFFVHHLYSALLVSRLEKTGTMESIFTGFKWFGKKEKS